ncbi:lysophospholipid acyltransferase family protein [Desulfonatronovibrio hydrogenovorans]|uniref:lysophospholipid acyltransferase family protein n=1 Tax=Desulfonatronovibrio hydrogenovorans TaxID=53245 RepID=UPI00049140BB|nr:lysophospholipid acyltransferase family protein [Desulfonatronovibrio hydrogenovorans]
MRVVFKILASLYLVVIFFIVSMLTLIFYPKGEKRYARITKNTALFSPILLWIMGVKFRVRDFSQGDGLAGSGLLVANHVSYVDVFVLAAVRPMLFISSVELSRKFFVGHVSKLGGTVFVERRSYSFLRKEIGKVADIIKLGFLIALFPEARTSDGTGVLQFRPALFEAAVKSGADVIPVCLNYLKINGQSLSRENKDQVFFHGGVKFLPHIIRLFNNHDIEVEVSIFNRLPAKSGNRKELVRQSYQMIRDCYSQSMKMLERD